MKIVADEYSLGLRSHAYQSAGSGDHGAQVRRGTCSPSHVSTHHACTGRSPIKSKETYRSSLPASLTYWSMLQVFVTRNIANMVVNTDFSLLAVLQYAVHVLEVLDSP